jgi:hypothetical protein
MPGRRKARSPAPAPATAKPAARRAKETEVAVHFGSERDKLIALLDGLLYQRDCAASGKATEADYADALKLLKGVIWTAASWALPSPRAPADGAQIESYRVQLGSALLALGFSDIGWALHAWNFGSIQPVLRPSRRIVRGAGYTAWVARVILIGEANFLRGLLSNKRIAYDRLVEAQFVEAESPDGSQIEITLENLIDWEKSVPPQLNAESYFAARRRDGAAMRTKLLEPDTAITPEQFADAHIACNSAAVIEAYRTAMRDKDYGQVQR